MNFNKKKIGIALLLILAIAATIAYLIINRKNIHYVNAGSMQSDIMRSAQLNSQDFKKLIAENDIDIVLNLRGKSKKTWYTNEKELTEELDLEYFTYGFSVYRPPDKTRFLKILDVLDKVKNEKKKLLIHCHAGADRTGLVSTIAQIYLYGFSLDEAKAISYHPYYGHLPDLDGALEQVLEQFRPYEKEMNFREFIETKYDRDKILSFIENNG